MWFFGRFGNKRSKRPHLQVCTFQSGLRVVVTVTGRVGIMSDTIPLIKILQRIDSQSDWNMLIVDFGGIWPMDNRFDTTIVALVYNVLAVARPRQAECEVWFFSREPYRLIFDLSHLWRSASENIYFHEDRLLSDITTFPRTPQQANAR